LGVTLKDQGKLKESVFAYKKALSINPDDAQTTENFWSLKTQLRESIFNKEKGDSYKPTNSLFARRPKYQIFQAIYAFLMSDYNLANKHLKLFNNCDQELIALLTKKDTVFCSAYNKLLTQLIKAVPEVAPIYDHQRHVFHLGESHCLSYAHKKIKINGTAYTVAPRITFGGKAYHFSTEKDNAFKAITKANFQSLPNASKVFVSFGEIDCRPNEGFIYAASRLNKKIETIIFDTVEKYLRWFEEQNQSKNHSLFFFNVPAPIYNENYTKKVNDEVKNTIKLFNNLLREIVVKNHNTIIDVYKFTVGHNGYSNSSFHIDGYHLSSDAIPEIEKQIGV